MNHRIPLALLTLAASGLAPSISVADSGLYLVASYGLTDTSGRKSQADTTISNLGVTAFTSTADEKDNGYKLQVGYRFNPYVAVEGGYMDLGRYTYHAVATVPAATRDGKGTIDAWNIDVVGRLPVGGQVSLLGKVGAARHQLKFHCDGTGIACVNPDREAKGTSLHYGIGAEWAFSPSWFARGEYEVVQKIGDSFNTNGTSGTSREDLKMGSVGVGYRF